MPKRALFSFVVLALFIASPGPAQAPKRFSIPPGYDGTNEDSIFKAAHDAAARGEWLAAEAFYKRLQALDVWGNDVGGLLKGVHEEAEKEAAGLSPEQRTAYEEFRAGVVMPEILARVPALRLGMDALLKAGDEEAAAGYAETIVKILPHDAGAAAALQKRLEASLQNAKKSYASGDILTAAMLLARGGEITADAGALAGRVRKALKAHEKLQEAMNGDSGGKVAAAARALAAVYPGDALLGAAKKWETRPAGMAAIPSGHYLMGCTLGEGDCEIVETPAHRVSVKGFYMDRGEVTAAAYAGCVEAGKCASPLSSTDAPYCTWGDPKLGDHPINCVTWAQAKAYCAWAEKRLPTEAEWEYAARGGYNDRRYPWGNEEADCSRAVMADGCGRMGTWAEGSKAANGFGLLDMAGNVSEWVEDCLHDSYLGAPADGRAWTEGECTTRLLRDGSWFYRASGSFRVSNRSWLDPATQNPSAGFRCVKD